MEDKNVVIEKTIGTLTSVINSLSEKNNDSATATEVNPPESDKTELETNSPEVHSDTNDSNLEEAKKILNIQPRNFDENKKLLKEYLEHTEKNINFSRVKTDGGMFGWFDHKVTGYELNNLTREIQGEFKKVQERELQMLKEFQTVFNTFDSLDKEYISAILTNIAAIKKTNEELQITNEDLKQTIERQGLTISKLVSFKEKINDLTSEFQKHQELLSSLINFKEQLEINQNKIEKKLEEQEQTFSKLLIFKEEINALMSDFQKHEEQLSSLLNFKEQQEANQNKVEKKIEELSEHDNILNALLNTKLQESFDKISEIEKKTSKKIKRAYLLAIMSILFAVATFFISPFNKMTKSIPTQEITSITNNDFNNSDSNISSDTNDSINNNF